MTDMRHQVMNYVINTLQPEEEISVYTLDQFTNGEAEKRKYMGHVLHRLCNEDKLLILIDKHYEHKRWINVYRKRASADEIIQTCPLQTLWRGTK